MDTAETPPVPPQSLPVKPPKSDAPLRLGILLFLLVCAIGELAFVLTRASEPTYYPPTVARPFFLTLDENAGTVTAMDSQVLVSGKTFANATVAVYSDTDTAIVESDTQGRFESTVSVGDTGGVVGITAYGPAGEEMTKTIAFSSVANGVLGVSNKVPPGQVKKTTGASDTKTNAGKNQNVLTPEAAAAVKIKETKLVSDFEANRTPPPKQAKLSVGTLKDLIALESTKSAQRPPGVKMTKLDITEASSGATLSRRAVSGVITAVDGTTITVSHLIHRERTWTVLVNAQTVITGKDVATGSATLTVGMRIAAVGQPTDLGLLAERIHIIPGKAIGVWKRFPVATSSAQVSPTPVASPSASPTETITPTETVTPTATPTATLSP
jgi:hypothetical protein